MDIIYIYMCTYHIYIYTHIDILYIYTLYIYTLYIYTYYIYTQYIYIHYIYVIIYANILKYKHILHIPRKANWDPAARDYDECSRMIVLTQLLT